MQVLFCRCVLPKKFNFIANGIHSKILFCTKSIPMMRLGVSFQMNDIILLRKKMYRNKKFWIRIPCVERNCPNFKNAYLKILKTFSTENF